MAQRPLPVTLIGWLFIVTGTVGFVYHLRALFETPVSENVLIELIRIAAVLGGIWLLRGANWARWLIVVWIAYHVILSFGHSISGVLVHLALLLVVTVFLTRPEATAYFRGTSR